MKTFRVIFIEGYQIKDEQGNRRKYTMFQVIADTEEDAFIKAKEVGVKRDFYISNRCIVKNVLTGQKLVKVYLIQCFDERNDKGEFKNGFDIEVYADNLKEAFDKAKKVCIRKNYRLSNYIETYENTC